MTASSSRRIVLRLLGSTAIALGLARPAAAALSPTPPQSTGPFYPPPADRFADTDWDLVKVAGAVRDAGGEIMHLAGRVVDGRGTPVAGALIEIWQCDANGRYLHSGDAARDRARDPGFQGYGATRTDAEGRYRFRTILPVPYPGRTPHIHARVTEPDGWELTTQIYLRGHPLNRDDILFRRLGEDDQAKLSTDPRRRADGDLEAEFDFIV